LEKSHFSEEEAAPIFRQIIDAIKYLHGRGITHRDLKPENILFRTKSPDSPIVLADFGFAKRVMGANRLMHSDVGTPDYAAPEILAFSYTDSVDMWACGCILYCMLYCIPPYYDDSPAETLRRVTTGQPVEFYDHYSVSQLSRDLIKGLLERNPKSRLTADGVLRHPWFLQFLPVLTPPSVKQEDERWREIFIQREHSDKEEQTKDEEQRRQMIINSIFKINDILTKHRKGPGDESTTSDGPLIHNPTSNISNVNNNSEPSPFTHNLRDGLKNSINMIIFIKSYMFC